MYSKSRHGNVAAFAYVANILCYNVTWVDVATAHISRHSLVLEAHGSVFGEE